VAVHGVKPPVFEYVRAESIEHAVDAISALGDDAKFIAGGQSLVPLMAIRLSWPSHLIDVSGVGELSGISVAPDGALTIGASTVQRSIERSPEVAKACPLLPDAISYIGHFPVRNRGTIGGSLAHGDPASELPLCAVVLDAELVTRRPGDVRRVVPASEFFLGPLMTDLQPDELVVEVRFPAWPAGGGWGFAEFSRRSGDFAIVAVAAILRLADDGTIAEGRIAVSGVGSTPLRVPEAEAVLHRRPADGDTFARAGAEVAGSIDPHSDSNGSAAYHRNLAAVLVERALADAHGRATAGA
jgi:aerobic carbon-monoxide dehydrogenase medium subunit